MLALEVKNILEGNPAYLYIANLTANPINLPNHWIVAITPDAPSSILKAQDDKPPGMERNMESKMLRKIHHDKHSILVVHYKH